MRLLYGLMLLISSFGMSACASRDWVQIELRYADDKRPVSNALISVGEARIGLGLDSAMVTTDDHGTVQLYLRKADYSMSIYPSGQATYPPGHAVGYDPAMQTFPFTHPAKVGPTDWMKTIWILGKDSPVIEVKLSPCQPPQSGRS